MGKTQRAAESSAPKTQQRRRKAKPTAASNVRTRAARLADRFGKYGENRLTAREIKNLTVLCGVPQLCGPLGKDRSDGNGGTVELSYEDRQLANVYRLIRRKMVEYTREICRFVPIYLAYFKRSRIDTDLIDIIMRDQFDCLIAGIQDADLFTDPSIHQRKVKKAAEAAKKKRGTAAS